MYVFIKKDFLEAFSNTKAFSITVHKDIYEKWGFMR